MKIIGTVLRSTGSEYVVQTSDGVYTARMKGKFRLQTKNSTNPIAVGDEVGILLQSDETAVIDEILPRKNKLSRRAAGRRAHLEHIIVANIDFAWCVQSVQRPKFNPGFIDRFLVMCEIEQIPAGILLNKSDLLNPELNAELQPSIEIYQSIGYPVVRVSAHSAEGLKELQVHLANKACVLSGPSGAGKSSLLNQLAPESQMRTAEISESTQKGKHTTTFAQLHPLPFGGFIADTPGLREFGIYDLHPDDLSGFFPEMRPYLSTCRFQPCTHEHEPHCGVKEAVSAGQISIERYTSYLNILSGLKQGLMDRGR